MSATVSAAIKAQIETLGLGVTVAEDGMLGKPVWPRIVIHPRIAATPNASSKRDGRTRLLVRDELAQVDVYQLRRAAPDVNGKRARIEDPTIESRLYSGLDGVRLNSIDGAVVWACFVVQSRRIPDPDDNVVHDALTLQITRNLA